MSLGFVSIMLLTLISLTIALTLILILTTSSTLTAPSAVVSPAPLSVDGRHVVLVVVGAGGRVEGGGVVDRRDAVRPGRQGGVHSLLVFPCKCEG